MKRIYAGAGKRGDEARAIVETYDSMGSFVSSETIEFETPEAAEAWAESRLDEPGVKVFLDSEN